MVIAIFIALSSSSHISSYNIANVSFHHTYVYVHALMYMVHVHRVSCKIELASYVPMYGFAQRDLVHVSKMHL